MQVLIILYKSALDIERVKQLFRERAGKYGAVPGLLQKLYVHDPATAEAGGIYLFESSESLDSFRRSDLESSIRETYQFTAPPVIRALDVVQALHEVSGRPDAAPERTRARHPRGTTEPR